MLEGGHLFSDHALFEMHRRNIDKVIVLQTINNADSQHEIRPGRHVFHKTIIVQNTGKALLYRVFVDIDRNPPVIVTAYATSKIHKYRMLQ